jgi:hypothetical protein
VGGGGGRGSLICQWQAQAQAPAGRRPGLGRCPCTLGTAPTAGCRAAAQRAIPPPKQYAPCTHTQPSTLTSPHLALRPPEGATELQAVSLEAAELVEQAMNPRYLCRMDPTWAPWWVGPGCCGCCCWA